MDVEELHPFEVDYGELGEVRELDPGADELGDPKEAVIRLEGVLGDAATFRAT